MILAIILLISASILSEVAGSIGKVAIGRKMETAFSMSFLNMLWAFGIFGATLLVRPDAWHFSLASIPLLLIRFVLECLQVYWSGEAVALASRGTFGLVRSLTIPFVLLADILLGYTLDAYQLLGIGIVFLTLVVLASIGDLERKGIGFVLLSAVNAAITISIFKFSITHYNSIPTEQFLITGGLLTFVYIMARRDGEYPLRLFRQPMLAGQSAAFGTGSLLAALAYQWLPASIATTFSRALDVIWSIVFGKAYFKEAHLATKLIGCAIIVVGLVLLAR